MKYKLFAAGPIADGYAYYTIVRENKRTVRIECVAMPDGLALGYKVPYWGDEATIDKEYALQSLRARDSWPPPMEFAN